MVKALNVEESPGVAVREPPPRRILERAVSFDGRSLFAASAVGSVQERRHALARELVGALVLIMAGMALDPVPANGVAGAAFSSRCHSSTFFTGFLSAVRQPFFFQPLIQLVMPPRR